MKRLWLIVVTLWLLMPGPARGDAPPALGLFLGIDDPTPAQLAAMGTYPRIAVDMAALTKDHVRTLHARGVAVYAYLSIGSLEKYRPWYDIFRDHVLHPYDNWPDEWWMDMTYAPWRDHLVSYARDTLLAAGADGLFLDNGDVYYQDQRDASYQALLSLLQDLHRLGKPMILNGGDVLLGRMMDEEEALPLQGVHQESVFASILDYDRNRFGRQSADTTQYYLSHLLRCHGHGLECYITEYTRDRRLESHARKEAARLGFGLFVTDDVGLRKTVPLTE